MILYKALIIDLIALMKFWAVGFFGFHITGIIHILPVIAIFAFLVSLLFGKTYFR